MSVDGLNTQAYYLHPLTPILSSIWPELDSQVERPIQPRP